MHSYLLWATPTLVVALAIAFLKWNASRAALLGLALTVPIAFFSGPIPFSIDKLGESLMPIFWAACFFGALRPANMRSAALKLPLRVSTPMRAAEGFSLPAFWSALLPSLRLGLASEWWAR
jgi:hypothetical protein